MSGVIAGNIPKNTLDYIKIGGGSYYGGQVSNSQLTTGAIVANVLRAQPMPVRKGFSIDRIQFEVSTLGAGKCVVGIYDNDPLSVSTTYPRNLIVQGTEQDTGTTGEKTDVINNILLDDTLYWVVYNANATPTLRCLQTYQVPPILGGLGVVTANMFLLWSVAQAYNAILPSVFPTGASLPTAPAVPFIQVRAK